MKRRITRLLGAVAGSALIAGYLLHHGPAFAQTSDPYVNPQPVEITGYRGSAMEPFISLDGNFLFFNNDDDPRNPGKSIYFAKRTGTLSFAYLGELPGVNKHLREKVEAAPSMDRQGRFYFTSTGTYERDRHTVFVGNFDGARVTNVHAVEGDINTGFKEGALNMDMSISPDGNTLYISRAQLGLLSLVTHAPVGCQLLIARRSGDRFNLDPNSASIMQSVNTGLVYAPAVSADERELYYNEGSHIMVATRSSADRPFGPPRQINSLTGFVEAPTLSADGSEMFFHKKVDDVCCTIYRATRSASADAAVPARRR